MTQNFTALNTMYRKTLGMQTTYRSPKGAEKQIDYILIKRRHLKHSKDAEANDTVHMDSDHRCVVAAFVITAQKRIAPAMLTATKRERLQWEISVHGLVKRMLTKKHSRSKEDIKNSKKRSNMNRNRKFNLKQSEDGSTTETTEAEAEK